MSGDISRAPGTETFGKFLKLKDKCIKAETEEAPRETWRRNRGALFSARENKSSPEAPAPKKAKMGHQERKSGSHSGRGALGPRLQVCPRGDSFPSNACSTGAGTARPSAPLRGRGLAHHFLRRPSGARRRPRRQMRRGWVTPSSLCPDTGHEGRSVRCRFYMTRFYYSYMFSDFSTGWVRLVFLFICLFGFFLFPRFEL